MTLENIERKGENAGCQHFLLFPQYSPKYQIQISKFEQRLKMSSSYALNFDKSKILSCDKRLKNEILLSHDETTVENTPRQYTFETNGCSIYDLLKKNVNHRSIDTVYQ